jgi:hypothetical protein
MANVFNESYIEGYFGEGYNVVLLMFYAFIGSFKVVDFNASCESDPLHAWRYRSARLGYILHVEYVCIFLVKL